MTKKIFRVAGMHCPNCAMQIEGLEDEVAGVVSVRVNYAKALMEVEFDEAETDLARIFEKAERKGYTLTDA